MRTLPRALSVAAATGLLLGGLSAPAATAAPVAAQQVAATAVVSTPASVAAVAKKKTPSIAWTTIKRKTLAPIKGKGREELRVPYLKNATSKARKAFDREISRQFAALRRDLKKSRSNYTCTDAVQIYSSKLGGTVYKGR